MGLCVVAGEICAAAGVRETGPVWGESVSLSKFGDVSPVAGQLSKPKLPLQGLLVMSFALSSIVFIEPAPFDLLIILLAALLIVTRPIAYKSFQKPAVWLLMVFLLINLGTVLAATDVPHALRYLMITTFVVVVFLALIGYVNVAEAPERTATIILQAWSITALITSLLGSLAYFGVGALDILLRFGRIQGLFKDPNVFGPFLIPPMLYLLALLLIGAKFTPSIMMSVLILMLGILLSFSRAAWINAVLATVLMIAMMWLARRRLPLRISFNRLIPLVALLFGFALLILAQPATKSFLEERSQLQAYDTDRFATQAEALDSFVNHPLGIGPGEVELAFDYATHSSYARTAAEYGILGLIVMFFLLILTLIRVWRMAYAGSLLHIIALSALLGLLVNSGVVDTIHWRHFWVVLAFCWFPMTVGQTKGIPNKTSEQAINR
jgi:O-antigen ligase